MKKIIALLLAFVICLSLVACKDEKADVQDTPTTEAVQTVGDVKITAENFETYFEFIEESFFTKDGSGNYAHLRFRHYYKLREQYNIDLSKSKLKLNYTYSYTEKAVTIDFENQKFTLGEDIGEKKVYENIPIPKISQITYKDFAILLLQPTHAVKGDTKIEYFSDFKIDSVEGTIHLIESTPTETHTHTHE